MKLEYNMNSFYQKMRKKLHRFSKNIDEKEEIWNLIRSQFIRLYVNKIWVGNPEHQIPIDNDSLNKFDFQF